MEYRVSLMGGRQRGVDPATEQRLGIVLRRGMGGRDVREAAANVAEAIWGELGMVYGITYAARTWDGKRKRIGGRAWMATIERRQSAMGRFMGTEPQMILRVCLSEGAVAAADLPGGAWNRRPHELGGIDGGVRPREGVCGGRDDLPCVTAEEQTTLNEAARVAWTEVERHRASGMSKLWQQRAEEAVRAEWARWAGRNRLAVKRHSRRAARRKVRKGQMGVTTL